MRVLTSMTIYITPVAIIIGGSALLFGIFVLLRCTYKARAQKSKANQTQLKAIIDSMTDVVFTLDTEQRHTGVYGRWLAHFQFDESFFLGRTATELMGEDAGAIHAAANRQALHGEEVIYEWVDTATDTHTQTRLSPIFNEYHQVIGLVGVGRDITELRRAERSLHRINRMYQLLSQCNKAVLYALNKPELTRQICRILAAEYAAVIVSLPDEGINITEGHPEPHMSRISLSLHNYSGGIIGALDVFTTTGDISQDERSLLDELAHNLGYGLTTIQMQIQQQQTQDALRVSANRYQAMFRDHKAVMLLIDPVDGQIVDANAAAHRFYGYDNLTSMKIGEINLLDPSQVKAEMQQAATHHKDHFSFRHRLASGQIRNVDVISGPVEADGRQLLYSIVQDVTERNRVQRALQISSERLSLFLEAATDAILIFDSALQLVEANSNAIQFYGLDYPNVMGQPLTVLIPDSHTHISRYQQVINTGNAWTYESEHEHKTMGRVILSVRVFKVGSGLGMVATDMTEKRRVEDAFLETHSLLQKTLASLDEAVLIVNPRSRLIVECNSRTEHMFGYGHEALVGTDSCKLHVSEEDFERFGKEALTAYDTVGFYATEYKMRRANGEIFHTEHLVTPLYSPQGELQNVVSVIRDITDRKQAEAELRRSEEQMRLVIQNMPVLLCAFDDQGDVIVWNKAAEQITGYKAMEVIGSPLILKRIFPDSDYRQRVVQTNQESEWEITCQNGEKRMISWFNISDNNPIPGWSSWIIGIDVTSRVQAQHALEDINYTLEKRVEERTFELLQARASEHEQRLLAEALRDSTNVLNHSLDLETVMDRILVNIGQVVPHDAINIMLLEGDYSHCVRAEGYAERGLAEWVQNHTVLLTDVPHYHRMVITQQPALIPHTLNDPLWPDDIEMEWIGSYIGAPIIIAGEVIGFINVHSAQSGYYNDTHIEPLTAFTSQAAVAVRNARLYEQAGELAVFEERQRLARDLHDAVTQTLFSANTLAKTLPRILETQPDKLPEYLLQLQGLTRGALAEMRNLLLELRPEAIDETPISKLITQLADAFSSRTGITLQVSIQNNETLTGPAKLVFYRITQEALNNIHKHTTAQQVSIHLDSTAQHIRLKIKDDGQGFNPQAIRGDHFGIKIMQERARSIQAEFKVESQPNQGTTLELIWEKS